MLYSGIFEAGILILFPKKLAQKIEQHYTQKFFYQTDTPISFVLGLFKIEHFTCLLLSQVWCGQKTEISHKKRKEIAN